MEAYLSYLDEQRIPFTIPGHKQKASKIWRELGRIVDGDVPLYGGLDEIKLTNNTLKKAESLSAKLWGGEWARFSSGGSTHTNQATILGIAKKGGKVAVTRNAHRSVLSGLVLAGLEPLWMFPEIDEKTGIPLGISPHQLSLVIQQKPIAVLLTEPGYMGTLSQLGKLIEISHQNEIPVIVDSAWGAHFGFHKEIPKNCLQMGADVLITSVHKNLPGYSASSLVVAREGLVDLERLEQSFETTHTTSPAGSVLASIDACRCLMEMKGEELLSTLLFNVKNFKNQVNNHFNLDLFLDSSHFEINRFDPTKLVLLANRLGASGIAIEKELQKRMIRVEMADNQCVVFIATICDDQNDFQILADNLIEVLEKLKSHQTSFVTSLNWSVKPQFGITMRDAYFSPTEIVPKGEAIGRISADLIAPYPPGNLFLNLIFY